VARGSVAPSAAVRTRLAGLGSSSRHSSRTFSLKTPHSLRLVYTPFAQEYAV